LEIVCASGARGDPMAASTRGSSPIDGQPLAPEYFEAKGRRVSLVSWASVFV
jgi:hypothetical protein